ncbi:MAG: recombination-associated protein RdgC [Deltaproteobacteria bacterium]|nr:recombination-associated protein RdgC [Deltaproteobacteria bacterium]
MKGQLTFSRYEVSGDLPSDPRDFIDRQIKLFSFKDLLSESEKIMGWTSLENVLDTDFEYANYLLDDYIVFSLRIDRKMVPASLLRLKTLEEERARMKDKGVERLYKAERNDIRDAVRLNLLKKTPSVPSFYEVCWSLPGKWVIFGSHTEKVADDFEDLFKRTFKLKLIPSVPWNPAFVEPDAIKLIQTLERQT